MSNVAQWHVGGDILLPSQEMSLDLSAMLNTIDVIGGLYLLIGMHEEQYKVIVERKARKSTTTAGVTPLCRALLSSRRSGGEFARDLTSHDAPLPPGARSSRVMAFTRQIDPNYMPTEYITTFLCSVCKDVLRFDELSVQRASPCGGYEVLDTSCTLMTIRKAPEFSSSRERKRRASDAAYSYDQVRDP